MTKREEMDVDEDIPQRIDTKSEAEQFFKEAKSRFDVDIEFIPMEWQNMGATAGRTESRMGNATKVLLNPKLLENLPDETPLVIIHELAHVSQIEQYSKFGTRGHDHYWEKEMRKAGIGRPQMYLDRMENLADNYIIECQKCGNRVGRKRKSKVIKNPELYTCKCGGSFERIK